jgi:hypothetical protein
MDAATFERASLAAHTLGIQRALDEEIVEQNRRLFRGALTAKRHALAVKSCAENAGGRAAGPGGPL